MLYDYIETFVNDNLGLDSERHVRIKILNEKGYEWATKTERLYIDDEEDRISDIEGVTYYLDKDGKQQEKELDDKIGRIEKELGVK